MRPVDGSRRGTLRVYLGAAPGVGKTFAMLDEGRRRAARGTDVVVAVVETHGRRHTAELLEGLEVVPRRRLRHRGTDLDEMDLDAVLRRAPEVALVDELAHSCAPGSRHEKRWQDVEALLDAGVDVVTTVNVQHLESLVDVVAAITGVRQQETVPDTVVRAAEQVELVDMSPEALRRRMAHGNVYPPERVDAALADWFRVGNLTALRELALLWVADRVDAALEDYRERHGIVAAWPARERVLVAVTGGPESETLLRRGARIASRGSGTELLAVHVSRSDGLTGTSAADLARTRALAEGLGARWQVVVGDDVPAAVLDLARAVNATQVVLGASRRGRVAAALAPGVVPQVVRASGDIDVYVVTHERAARRALLRQPRTNPVGRARLTLGWVLALLAPTVLGLVLQTTREAHALSTVVLLFLTATVVVAVVGGLRPAVLAALLSGLLSNYLFTEPYYTLRVDAEVDLVTLVVLVLVAVTVATAVDRAARASAEAARARAEADVLTGFAHSVLSGRDSLADLLEQLRTSFGLEGVDLVARGDGGGDGAAVAAVGAGTQDPRSRCAVVDVDGTTALRLAGARLGSDELRVVSALATQVAAVLERDRLREEARTAKGERERTRTRTALLAAVSHDLRTPLAGIKAGVSTLLSRDIPLRPEDRDALLRDVDLSTDRLQALIDNLLDMSRLDAGAVVPRPRPSALEDVVARALSGVEPGRVQVDVPHDLPLLDVDAGLLERAVANVAENAVRYAGSAPVAISAALVPGSVVLRVADRGAGVPEGRRARLFAPFQRLGDTGGSPDGLGLGLAVARGLAEVNGGTLDAEDTPGGGLTMVFRLPVTPLGVTS
ncbi:DUF4118 domain-containing protein [Aquipuribacter hungaricus]|uniref:histidine kinase n=1 Tax=Aquipuribacter hungaricus TaxID=545624 RepID=A0ABV7WJL9_9MICO